MPEPKAKSTPLSQRSSGQAPARLFIGTSAFYNSRRSGTHPKERDLQPSKIRDMKFIAAALDCSHTGPTL
jgi:hypothetical protein